MVSDENTPPKTEMYEFLLCTWTHFNVWKYPVCLKSHMSHIMYPFMYYMLLFQTAENISDKQVCLQQRSSECNLNDNEYMCGVCDYVTTEMEMQKSRAYWDVCLHGTLLLPACVYMQLN